GHAGEAARLSERLGPLWTMFSQHGSLRVVAAAAELRELAVSPSLPLPLEGRDGAAQSYLADLVDKLELGEWVPGVTFAQDISAIPETKPQWPLWWGFLVG